MIRRLEWLLPRTLQGTLLVAFAALVTITVVGVGVAVAMTGSQQVLGQMHDRIAVAAHVLDRFLDSRQLRLQTRVQSLVDDFGLRTAVATRDPATIATVMANQRQRINADFLLLLNNAGHAIAATQATASGLTLTGTLATARQAGSAAAAQAHAGQPHQLFVAPVRTDDVIGWAVAGFAIDQDVVDEVAELTGLEVSFLTLAGDGAVTAGMSTLSAVDPALLAALSAAAESTPDNPTATPAGRLRIVQAGAYLNAIRPLTSEPGAQTFAVLQMPTRIIHETTGLLIQRIVLGLAACLALAAPIGIWLAHRISDPLRRLTDSVRNIESGDYQTPVVVRGTGDVARLGLALATMQQGIRQREDQIHHQADHDDLTGLPNLRALKRTWSPVTRPYTLCLLSIGNFKDVTFSYGYAAGDALLKAVTERLQAQPGTETVARVSGRGFAVIMPELNPTAALARTRQLQQTVSGTYRLGLRSVTCQIHGAVIGYPGDADNFAALYRGAEVALDEAMATPDGCAAFVPEREEMRARHLAIIASLERAAEQGEFALHYQPKIDLASGVARECEALLRWNHPELGFVPPDEFIQLAERSGNIRRITGWVIDAAIGQAARWHSEGIDLAVAINLSAHDLADPSLPDVVEQTLRRHGVAGSRLTVEITESAVMHDPVRAAAALMELKTQDIRLSIDDFGTGHSSLAQLKQLPVDELKIDKSFVLELDRDADDALIVGSTIELGHNLGLTVVAEGVENQASLARLVAFHCDKVQGYHFSRPLPAAELTRWLQMQTWEGVQQAAS